MLDLTITQKAGCEAIWRAFDERGVDKTGFDLAARPINDARDLVEHISRYSSPVWLDDLTYHEVHKHGPLKSGYSLRWGTQYADNQKDAKGPPPYKP